MDIGRSAGDSLRGADRQWLNRVALGTFGLTISDFLTIITGAVEIFRRDEQFGRVVVLGVSLLLLLARWLSVWLLTGRETGVARSPVGQRVLAWAARGSAISLLLAVGLFACREMSLVNWRPTRLAPLFAIGLAGEPLHFGYLGLLAARLPGADLVGATRTFFRLEGACLIIFVLMVAAARAAHDIACGCMALPVGYIGVMLWLSGLTVYWNLAADMARVAQEDNVSR